MPECARCGSNTASFDSPHHLSVLLEKLQHATDYEKAVFYFLETLANDVGFVTGSIQSEAPHLMAILRHITSRVFGESARLDGTLMLYRPDYSFYHGHAAVAGQTVLFFYFVEADLGVVAFMPLDSGESLMTRFQIKDALIGGNPTKN